MAKNIVLTIDYEVFLGEDTGNLREVLIAPTYKLMEILRLNGSKMTVFWDIMHYDALCRWSKEYPQLKEEKLLIEQQIKDLVAEGHDVQMHLHPHWLDAKFNGERWIFDYSRFSLHKYNPDKDEKDVNTIYGCVLQMKHLMEEVICSVKPDYHVITYRAGGYLIEPFEDLADAFKAAGITKDSSVCPGLVKRTTIYPYDFKGYPNRLSYRFGKSPRHSESNGEFVECPVYTIRLGLLYRIKRIISRRNRVQNKEKLKGKGINFPMEKRNRIQSFIDHLFNNKIQLTLDGADAVQFNYSLKKAPQNAVMILHPKMQTEASFNLIKESIFNGNIKYNTLD